MTDRHDEIRGLIREATPGPWETFDHGSPYRLGVSAGSMTEPIVMSTESRDARLIAAAPELLAWCVAEIERLRGVNDGVRDWAQGRVDTLTGCIDGNRVDLTTRTEMMYERTIMRDLVAMLDEGET